MIAGGPHLIVEADGGSRGNPGPAGYGALVREVSTGRVIAERGEPIGRATNNVAEYRGLIAGLEAASDFEPSLVEVRMDSKLVVEQMSGRWQIKHADLRPLAMQAQRLARQFPKVTYTWIPREQNSPADRLANQALDGVPIGASNPSLKRGRTTTPGWAPTDADPGAPTRLFLVRHGVTEHSAERRFSGRNDLPLTPEGQKQIASAAGRLAARGSVGAVVASPLRRARESADIVGDALHLPVDLDDDLAELDFGQFEGLTWAEARAEFPSALDAFLGAADVAPPGGETIVSCRSRVQRALRRITLDHAGRDVVVVTHVTPIKILLCAGLDVPLTAVHRFFLAPASLSIAEWYADGRSSVTLVNDTSHWEQP